MPPEKYDPRKEVLRQISEKLTNIRIETYLADSVALLDFLLQMEEKEEEDKDKISSQRRLVKHIESLAYREEVLKIVEKEFGKLSDDHLRKYLDNLVYEEAVLEVTGEVLRSFQSNHEDFFTGSH